jgi:hypothetical protein
MGLPCVVTPAEQSSQGEVSVSNDRDTKIVLHSVSSKGFISHYGFVLCE